MSDTISERRLRRRQLESSDEAASTLSGAPSAASAPADVSSLAGPPLAGDDCWRPIDAKALSGVPVFVRGGAGQSAEAYYVETRQRVGVKWEPTGIWRDRNGAGLRLSFEPVEYREVGFAPLYQPGRAS